MSQIRDKFEKTAYRACVAFSLLLVMIAVVPIANEENNLILFILSLAGAAGSLFTCIFCTVKAILMRRKF